VTPHRNALRKALRRGGRLAIIIIVVVDAVLAARVIWRYG
jgi:hypothetical protein